MAWKYAFAVLISCEADVAQRDVLISEAAHSHEENALISETNLYQVVPRNATPERCRHPPEHIKGITAR